MAFWISLVFFVAVSVDSVNARLLSHRLTAKDHADYSFMLPSSGIHTVSTATRFIM